MAKQKAVAAEAKKHDPEEQPLAALASIGAEEARKMKVPALRDACKMRHLDDAGLKEALVERLVAWRLPPLAALPPAAPAGPCTSVEGGCFW